MPVQPASGPGGSGRLVPDPGFAGDDGTADAALRAALADYGVDPARQIDVFLALQGTRVLVPVVAILGQAELDAEGLTHDKSSDMATALLTGRDGRQALLAFTGLDTLEAWRPGARPVPVTAALAARSALQEGAAALLLDVAGPTTYAVEGPLLEGLARGWPLVLASDGSLAWIEE
ncbi:MAG TPA: SseB family protein [Nocardioides sp.]|jgi:hypothetical protein|nr:SseB family protein [Nocardioides sp.]